MVVSRAHLIRTLERDPDAWRHMSIHWSRAEVVSGSLLVRETITGSPAFLHHLAKYPSEIRPDDTRSLPIHPTQLYMSFSAFVVCGLLVLWRRWRRRPGEVFAALALLYSVVRFINEGLRDDTSPVLGELTISQVISVGVFAVGLAGFLACRLRTRKA